MADRIRSFAFGAVVLPFLFLAIPGLARANVIIVTTTAESAPFPDCSLDSAVLAANGGTTVQGCNGAHGANTIAFFQAGTYTLDEPLLITDSDLTIQGVPFGCAGVGPCGVVISGANSTGIIDHEAGELTLSALTLETDSHLRAAPYSKIAPN